MKESILEVCSYYMGTNLYQNLFEQFAKKNIEHDILYFCARPTVIKRELPDNFILSQPYEPMDRLIFSVKHRKVYEDIKTKINVNKYYMSHAHSLVSNGYISLRLKEEFGIPYIVAVRNTDLFVFLKWYPFIKETARKILDEAENIIFLSPTYRDLTIEKYARKVNRDKIASKSYIIPNGIDNYFLENRNFKIKEKNSKVNLIYVGRIDDLNKNIITTIKVCKQLIKEGYDAQLTVVGRLENTIFKKLISKYSFIKYIPKVDKFGVRGYLDNNDIFIMPSKRETFGLVYVEAMSQGLPVIYTKGQGFDGHFPEGHVGYHVTYNDIGEIVMGIKNILNNYNNISKNASQESLKFDWNNISEEYIEIYENVRKKYHEGNGSISGVSNR